MNTYKITCEIHVLAENAHDVEATLHEEAYAWLKNNEFMCAIESNAKTITRMNITEEREKT